MKVSEKAIRTKGCKELTCLVDDIAQQVTSPVHDPRRKEKYT